MLKKSEETPIPSTNRYKLPLETEIRSLAGIKELLAMAKESRGTQIELSWTTKNPDQIFVLDVQWDVGQKEPFWCLYEENTAQSKRLWAQPFSVNNIEMFYDILVMSCGAVDHSKNLFEILKAKPNSDKEEGAKAASHNASSASTDAAIKTDSSSDASQTNQINQPGVNFPGMPGSVPSGNWTYAAYGQPGLVPGQPVPGSLDAFLLDNTLLNKQNDVGLIDLLIKAELLTEPVLAAALRMRDLVLAKQLSMEKAVELLKRDYNKGESIGDYIESSVIPAGAAEPSKSVSASEKPSKTEDKELAGCLGLLEKAGLLCADDIKTARGVSRKHGGDLVSILGAAQKLDTNTLAAAKICNGLEQGGLMKLEQCVIVLNYCSRSRVSFDEAMSELNWENPRSAKK